MTSRYVPGAPVSRNAQISRFAHVFYYIIYALAVLWIFLNGTPYENTLWLAASGKVDLGLSFFYRFRDSAIPTDGSWGGPVLSVLLWSCKYLGMRAFWAGTILLQAAFLRREAYRVKFAALLLLTAGLIWGEALLVWNLLFTSLVVFQRQLATPRKAITMLSAFVALVCLLGSVQLAWIFGNSARLLTRQRVLGGKSVMDILVPRLRTPGIELHESCVAAINPDDLHGVQSTEILSRSSLNRFAAVTLLDLKVVEANYRFLTLKDEKGDFLFSHAARTYAEKEKVHAAAVRAGLENAANLCLIAPFDVLPEKESPPFSRAREILNARSKAGLSTKVIQLPVR